MQIERRRPTVRSGLFAMAGMVGIGVLLLGWQGLSDFPLATGIQAGQRQMHERLVEAVDAIAAGGLLAAGGLAVASYLYGILHAAGPGHGKVILTTYLATHAVHLRRGLTLSLVSALCQGVSAILLVEITFGLLGWAAARTQHAVVLMEAASFALMSVVGGLLVIRSARRLWRGSRTMRLPPRLDAMPEDRCDCGHDHAPDQHAIEAARSWREATGVVLAIGLRPCTGAILVLLATRSIGLHAAGIGAVLAMSLGTASAVALIAFVTIHARRTARWIANAGPSHLRAMGAVFGMLGGAIILGAGLILLDGVTRVPQHPLL